MFLSFYLSQPTGGRQSPQVTHAAAWEASLLNVPDRSLGQSGRFRPSVGRGTSHCLLFKSSFLEQWKNKNQWRCGGVEVPVPDSVSSPGGFLLFIWSPDRGVASCSAVSEQVLELWSRPAHTGVQLLPLKQWTRPITISVWALLKNTTLKLLFH